MTPKSTPDHKTDHRKAAEKLVAWLGDPADPSHRQESRDLLVAATAQAHSNLAIAEALEDANQARREGRASAVEELRRLVEEALNGEVEGDWDLRARKTLALFEAAPDAS